MRLVPMNSGDEHDALTRWRKFLRWRPGVRSRIKRMFRRRERHSWIKHVKHEDWPAYEAAGWRWTGCAYGVDRITHHDTYSLICEWPHDSEPPEIRAPSHQSPTRQV